jgi:hypothetical protein
MSVISEASTTVELKVMVAFGTTVRYKRIPLTSLVLYASDPLGELVSFFVGVPLMEVVPDATVTVLFVEPLTE